MKELPVSSSSLSDEQAHIDRSYAELTRMRARAEELLESMRGVDPDLEWSLLRRVRALREDPRALCFGRLDTEAGESWYIGRRHVEDAAGDPVVVEWRAPVAVPFYRASRRDPMGLTRRRQFVVDGRELLSIGDDLFAEDTGASGGVDLDGMRGRDALMAELERARSGEMLDIVATIQPEQDEVIRSDTAGIMAVQGGPGSGKTAVGLHRAAFLLYGDDDMARAGVLVVGPNRTFLRYIASVLPSLGEHAVVQTTLVSLVPEVDGGRSARDAPEAERIKGDGRMAAVLQRALTMRRLSHERDLAVAVGVRHLRVDAAEINDLAERVAALELPYASGRDVLRSQLIGRLAARHEQATGLPPPDNTAFERHVRADTGFKSALDSRWPSVSPVRLVSDVLSKPTVLECAADGVLTRDEQAAIRRRGQGWTPADAALVDEAKALIAGQSRTYGYAIVDEAQDLSPMQLRMLSRRCPAGNMTLLGDLAQAVGVWGHRDWRELAAWLPTTGGLRVAELRYGYRSTGQVLELAGRLLPEAAPDVKPTEAVRPGRSAPRRRTAPEGDLLRSVSEEVLQQHRVWPTVAVVTPTDLTMEILARLRHDLGEALVGLAVEDGLGRAVTVIASEAAKGLEFDAVVVVEPSAIVAERTDPAAGLRLLYVALTRPTQHLSIVAAAPLPAALAD
jgi:DNA helicase IV